MLSSLRLVSSVGLRGVARAAISTIVPRANNALSSSLKSPCSLGLAMAHPMGGAGELGLFNANSVRFLNRNARRPKKPNHGKRPVSHARKREKQKSLKSRLYREKIFGFW